MGALELAVMAAMVAFNSVFAAYEIALAAVSPGRLKLLAGEGRRGAAAALHMKENVEASLAAVQLGITLFGAVAAATGGAGAGEQIAPLYQSALGLSAGWAEFLAVVTVVLPLTAATIMFGELVPKVFALRNRERVCLALSPVMRWFTSAVWPAVWAFEAVAKRATAWGERRLARGATATEAAELLELRAAATLARVGRLIGPTEEAIIHGAARLAARPVREILLPADGISTLPLGARLADALTAAHLDLHTRFPVTERAGDPQGIVGYVNVKDMLPALRLSPDEPSLKGLLRPLPSFSEAEPIAVCLERMLRDGTHIALVRDAAGQVTGMVTLEDVVEELLGDIRDEYDRLPTRVTAAGGGWVAGGGTPLDKVREATGLDLAADGPAGGAGTLDAWVAGHLGRPARGGDIVERAAARVVVRKVRRRHVLEAQLGRPARP